MRRLAKRAGALTLVAAVVAAVALFVHEYQITDDPKRSSEALGAGRAPAVPSLSISPTPETVRKAAKGIRFGTGAAPGVTITAAEPGGLHFVPPTTHRVVLTVSSGAPIGRLGYIAPASLDSAYGDVKDVGTHWQMSLRALGKPAYAALFVQAGAAGVPITCTVTVDGAVTSTKTTHGPYNPAVCVG